MKPNRENQHEVPLKISFGNGQVSDGHGVMKVRRQYVNVGEKCGYATYELCYVVVE